MLLNLSSILENPKDMLILFLLAFPGRILALSVHEFAHAWVANRCGDPTARLMGRMTINPLRHLDPLGTAMMLLVGYGWAKPVPVNPRNYRSYRKDDLKVSLAGVTMNLIMFALSMLLLFSVMVLALNRVPVAVSAFFTSKDTFRAVYNGESCVFWTENGSTFRISLSELMEYLPYYGSEVIRPVFGEIAGYLYRMLGYFAVTNLVLCVFNLLPVPPLDGYHVLNDLVLHKPLFASQRTAQIAYYAILFLVLTGAIGTALGWVNDQVLAGCGRLACAALRAMGIMA